MKEVILLIPEKTDNEFEKVAAAWISRGGKVKRLGKYWVRSDDIARQKIAIYGNQAFAFVLAQLYEVELISPDDSLIVRLDSQWTKRNIQLKQLDQISEKDLPVFIKPVVPKMFLAGIFQNLEELRRSTNGLLGTEQVIVSGIVDKITAEARCYVKDGSIKDIACYEGSGELISGKEFVTAFIAGIKEELPKVVVIDIAFSEEKGWFILEFNACWGSGLNNCNAEKILDCIIGATVNK